MDMSNILQMASYLFDRGKLDHNKWHSLYTNNTKRLKV